MAMVGGMDGGVGIDWPYGGADILVGPPWWGRSRGTDAEQDERLIILLSPRPATSRRNTYALTPPDRVEPSRGVHGRVTSLFEGRG